MLPSKECGYPIKGGREVLSEEEESWQSAVGSWQGREGEELGDVIHIVQLWVQQRLACSKRRRKKVKRMKRREFAVGSGQRGREC